MAKATFKLPTGTLVTIEGTAKEIQNLLEFYGGSVNRPGKNEDTVEETKITTQSLLGKKEKPEETDFVETINLAKTCDEAEVIEKNVLLQTNEANRALLPLFIIHEHLNNAFGLTTTEISRITIELGAKVSRQNALRALKFSASGFVIKQGNPPRYTLNKRGVIHMKTVLAGEDSSQPDTSKTSLTPTPRRVRRTRSKSPTAKKGPQALILELKDNGFFVEKKSLADIQRRLEELGYIYAQTSLSTPLLRLVKGNKLQRTKDNDSWLYSAS
jgi:hypothetical protein